MGKEALREKKKEGKMDVKKEEGGKGNSER